MIHDSEPTNNLPQWCHEDIKQKDAKYENIKSYDTSQIRGFSFNLSKLTWIWRKEENHLVMANSNSEDKVKIKMGHQPEVIQLEESRAGKAAFPSNQERHLLLASEGDEELTPSSTDTRAHNEERTAEYRHSARLLAKRNSATQRNKSGSHHPYLKGS